MRSLECYFGIYFHRCCATREMNTKTTLSWAHKPFATGVHKLFSLYIMTAACSLCICYPPNCSPSDLHGMTLIIGRVIIIILSTFISIMFIAMSHFSLDLNFSLGLFLPPILLLSLSLSLSLPLLLLLSLFLLLILSLFIHSFIYLSIHFQTSTWYFFISYTKLWLLMAYRI